MLETLSVVSQEDPATESKVNEKIKLCRFKCVDLKNRLDADEAAAITESAAKLTAAWESENDFGRDDICSKNRYESEDNDFDENDNKSDKNAKNNHNIECLSSSDEKIVKKTKKSSVSMERQKIDAVLMAEADVKDGLTALRLDDIRTAAKIFKKVSSDLYVFAD